MNPTNNQRSELRGFGFGVKDITSPCRTGMGNNKICGNEVYRISRCSHSINRKAVIEMAKNEKMDAEVKVRLCSDEKETLKKVLMKSVSA